MKRLLCFFLVVVLAAAASGCGMLSGDEEYSVPLPPGGEEVLHVLYEACLAMRDGDIMAADACFVDGGLSGSVGNPELIAVDQYVAQFYKDLYANLFYRVEAVSCEGDEAVVTAIVGNKDMNEVMEYVPDDTLGMILGMYMQYEGLTDDELVYMTLSSYFEMLSSVVTQASGRWAERVDIRLCRESADSPWLIEMSHEFLRASSGGFYGVDRSGDGSDGNGGEADG